MCLFICSYLIQVIYMWEFLFKKCINIKDTMMHNSIHDEQPITECPLSLFSSAGKNIRSLGETCRQEHRGLSARQQLPASGFWVPSSSHTAWKTFKYFQTGC